jgi:hypothetical protein
MWWRGADVGDQYRFPSRIVPAGDRVSPLPVGPTVELPAPASGEGMGFDAFLRDTGTLAFLVAHDDCVVYQRYFDGANPSTRETSFSVIRTIRASRRWRAA